MSRNEKAIGAWRHFRLRLEWSQKPQRVDARRIPRISLFNSSRTQKIISLSSREAELRAIVSSASDGIYINTRAVLELALGTKVDHYVFADSSSARQLVTKRGVGKVNHLDGKLL